MNAITLKRTYYECHTTGTLKRTYYECHTTWGIILKRNYYECHAPSGCILYDRCRMRARCWSQRSWSGRRCRTGYKTWRRVRPTTCSSWGCGTTTPWREKCDPRPSPSPRTRYPIVSFTLFLLNWAIRIYYLHLIYLVILFFLASVYALNITTHQLLITWFRLSVLYSAYTFLHGFVT